MPGLSRNKPLDPFFSQDRENTKKNNNIDPMLDSITLNIQRKLEEIVEQKTDPNWTLNVETMIFENLPSGT